MICLLLCVSHWPIIMIRPGGLPLEVSHLFAVSVLVSSTGLERKKKKLNLDVRSTFAGPHN